MTAAPVTAAGGAPPPPEPEPGPAGSAGPSAMAVAAGWVGSRVALLLFVWLACAVTGAQAGLLPDPARRVAAGPARSGQTPGTSCGSPGRATRTVMTAATRRSSPATRR